MTDLIPFTFEAQTLRVLLIDDAPWWVASDLCAVLGLRNPTMSLRKLDADQVALNQIEGLRGDGMANIVSESGMWTLVLRSDKPQAKRIRRWLTDEVLPQLRRTGSYSLAPSTPAAAIAQSTCCPTTMAATSPPTSSSGRCRRRAPRAPVVAVSCSCPRMSAAGRPIRGTERKKKGREAPSVFPVFVWWG